MSEIKNSKLLLVTGDFPPVIGGISTYLYELWKRINPEDTLVVTPESEGCSEFDRRNKFKVIRTPSVQRCLTPFVLAVRIIQLIRKEKVKLIICGQVMTCGLAGYLCKRLFNKKYIIFFYADEFRVHRGFWHFFMRIMLRNAEKIIAVSGFSKEECLRRVPEAATDKIVVLTPGVDTLRFSPQGDSINVRRKYNLENKLVLLTLSRLDENKGIDIMIKLMPQIKQKFPAAVYLIAGRGQQEEYLKRIASEVCPESIIFAGGVSDEVLPQYYRTSDVFVLLTCESKRGFVEGFGIVFLEANACGKPVISGKTGGAKEAVLDKVTGLQVDPFDKREVLEAIEKLFIDKELGERLAKQGRDRAVKNFSWDVKTEEFLKLIEL